MKVEANVIGVNPEGLVEVEARVPASVVAAHMEQCLSDLSSEHGIEDLTDYANAIEALGLQEAQRSVIEWFVDRTMVSALQELDQPVACSPAVDAPQVFSPEEDVRFVLCTYLLPKGKLSSADPVVVDAASPEALAARIDAQLRALAIKHGELKRVQERDAVRMGDVVELDVHVSRDGAAIRPLSRDGAMLKMQSGSMPDDFLNHVCGLREGETASFSFKAPDAAGIMGSYDAEVAIRALFQMSEPEVTDAWVAKMFPGMDSVADLRGAMADSLAVQGLSKDDEMHRAEDALIERLDAEVPEALLDFVFAQADDSRTRDEIRREVLLMSALDALFSERMMLITKQEIDEVLDAVVPEDDSEARQELILSGQMPLIEEQARREKAHRWLIETMTPCHKGTEET